MIARALHAFIIILGFAVFFVCAAAFFIFGAAL